MSQEIIQTIDKNTHLEITIKGVIDEDINLNTIGIISGKPIHVHIDGVTMINSTGIRQWVSWLAAYQNEKWFFWGCPPIFINQLNMIDSFIPKGSRVESFYVPFYSDETDEEKRILVKRDDYKGSPSEIPKQTDSAGNEMALDIMPDKYFKFMNRY